MNQSERVDKAGKLSLLTPHRDSLDEINLAILALLSERMKICMEIARIKAEHDIPMMQPGRVSCVLNTLKQHAEPAGLRAEYAEAVFKLVIDETCRQEEILIDQLLSRNVRHENTPDR